LNYARKISDDQSMSLIVGFVGTITAQDEARWRAALDQLGPKGVGTRLAELTSFDPNEMVEIGELMPMPSRQFVETWLHRRELGQRRVDTRRFWIMLLLEALAAVAALIAAIPTIQTWWAGR
jgi:hypothetical protein